MITKSVALEKFITERVLGERAFAFDTRVGACRYSHHFAGGCEIGQHLTEKQAEICDNGSNSGSSYRALRDVPPLRTFFDETFEQPGSEFWPTLQNAHDALAQMQDHASKQGAAAWVQFGNAWARWMSFEGYMHQLARLV